MIFRRLQRMVVHIVLKVHSFRHALHARDLQFGMYLLGSTENPDLVIKGRDMPSLNCMLFAFSLLTVFVKDEIFVRYL